MVEVHQVDRVAALTHPGYHRYVSFWPADRLTMKQTGRALLSHEIQSRLPWPQLLIVKRIERAIAARQGEIITVRMARQTGKNETEAFLESRALSIWSCKPGSVWVRMAPTYTPQIGYSIRRLEKFLQVDPLLFGQARRRGKIVTNGHAQVQFLSASKTANVVGATESVALSLDEAHKIDAGKFIEQLSPFTASTNSPIIMWGVAADKQDLLHEYHELNAGSDRHLEFPAPIWCELSEAFRAHYKNQVRRLGASHPVILTQYDLVDVEALGAYLKDAQRAALFSGDHPRLTAPRDKMRYVLLADLGGESEKDMGDELLRAEDPARDSTNAWILEYDPASDSKPYHHLRIVDGHWWTGRPHMESAPELIRIARHYRVTTGAIDARGVGEAVAGAVNRAIPAIKPYKATDQSVSEDCYDLLARLNTGRVQMWRSDPAADPEYRELAAQSRHTRYEITGHEKMRLLKPSRANLHIDGIKALTYIHRALKSPASGLLDYMDSKLAKRRADQEKTT